MSPETIVAIVIGPAAALLGVAAGFALETHAAKLNRRRRGRAAATILYSELSLSRAICIQVIRRGHHHPELEVDVTLPLTRERFGDLSEVLNQKELDEVIFVTMVAQGLPMLLAASAGADDPRREQALGKISSWMESAEPLETVIARARGAPQGTSDESIPTDDGELDGEKTAEPPAEQASPTRWKYAWSPEKDWNTLATWKDMDDEEFTGRLREILDSSRRQAEGDAREKNDE